MYSFIFPRESSKGRRALWLSVLVFGGPLLWFAMLQSNYVLTYFACSQRSNAPIYIASAVVTILSLAVLYATRSSWRKEPPELRTGIAAIDDQLEPEGSDPSTSSRFFLALLAVLTTVLFFVVVIGTALPPLILRPCD